MLCPMYIRSPTSFRWQEHSFLLDPWKDEKAVAETVAARVFLTLLEVPFTNTPVYWKDVALTPSLEACRGLFLDNVKKMVLREWGGKGSEKEFILAVDGKTTSLFTEAVLGISKTDRELLARHLSDRFVVRIQKRCFCFLSCSIHRSENIRQYDEETEALL